MAMAECVVISCCNALLGFALVRRDSLVEVKLGGFIKFASNSEFHKQEPSWWWSFQSRFNSVANSTSETSVRSVAECSRADSPLPTLARQVFVQKRPSRPNVKHTTSPEGIMAHRGRTQACTTLSLRSDRSSSTKLTAK